MKKEIVKYGIILIIIGGLSWLVSRYWFQLMLIQGDSMEPAYHSFQMVVLDKHFNEITYGDVIAFRCESLDAVLVKRVIALPGDTVELKEGTVYVNQQPADWISDNGTVTYPGIASEPWVLAQNQYFVLGDNYEVSKDSRYPEVGGVSEDTILGVVVPQKP